MVISETARAKALAAAIESMEPSAAVLNASGWQWQTATELAKQIKNGPDLTALKECGIGQSEAVEIASVIAARHRRRAAAFKPPAPRPAAPAKPPESEQLDPGTALSALHTLCQQIDRTRPACITEMCNAGFSSATSKEICAVINASRAANRGVHP